MPEDLALSNDRRIQRTRKLIADAFLSLLTERDFADIVVKDITERSNINRSTFYAHYQDKYDLLDKLMKAQLTALGSLPVIAYEPDFDRIDPYYAALFEHLAKHSEFYRVLLLKPLPSAFPDRMQGMIRESFYARISAIQMDRKLLVPLDILLDYLSASTLGLIRSWLEQQMVFSAHYMALQLTRLSILGTYRAMGGQDQDTNL